MKDQKTEVGNYLVSTVHIPALGFWETMVFAPKSANPWTELYMDRYDTEAAAVDGHINMVMKWRSKK